MFVVNVIYSKNVTSQLNCIKLALNCSVLSHYKCIYIVFV